MDILAGKQRLGRRETPHMRPLIKDQNSLHKYSQRAKRPVRSTTPLSQSRLCHATRLDALDNVRSFRIQLRRIPVMRFLLALRLQISHHFLIKTEADKPPLGRGRERRRRRNLRLPSRRTCDPPTIDACRSNALAEPTIADDPLRALLAILIRTLDLLRRHATADSPCEVEGCFSADVVV